MPGLSALRNFFLCSNLTITIILYRRQYGKTQDWGPREGRGGLVCFMNKLSRDSYTNSVADQIFSTRFEKILCMYTPPLFYYQTNVYQGHTEATLLPTTVNTNQASPSSPPTPPPATRVVSQTCASTLTSSLMLHLAILISRRLSHWN
jgi:hypothetical protein